VWKANCGKRQSITATCAVKSHFYTEVSALNCITQSKASEEFLYSCIWKCIPQLVPVVTYDVLNVSLFYCIVLCSVL
jgi:hypothetical protein